MELLILVGLAVAALVVGMAIQRRRRGDDTPSQDREDALTRACHGDRAQADRLEAHERERTSEQLSRAEARRRAAERLNRDRD